MKRRGRAAASAALLILSAGAYLAAPRIGRREEQKKLGIDQLGAFARPFRALLGFTRALVLPFLWSAAHAADLDGRIGDAVALARWIAFLLPESDVVWTVFGWRLAYDFSGGTSTPEEETERIHAGLRWLETGSQVLEDDAEICLTIALVLQDRMGRDDPHSIGLAEVWRKRTGKDPREMAEVWLREAERRKPGSVKWRFALNAEGRARSAWRAGDLQGARHWAETARAQFIRDAARGDPDSNAASLDLLQAVRALDVLLSGEPSDPEREEARKILASSRLSLK